MEAKMTMRHGEEPVVFADLSYDSAFKYMFADPKNKWLLNCVLPQGVRVRGIYHNELDEGEDYGKLSPVYVVALLNHRVRHEDEAMWDSDHILSHYTFLDMRTKEFAPPTIFIIFVELARFLKTNAECASESDWVYYTLRNGHELKAEPPESTETTIARST